MYEAGQSPGKGRYVCKNCMKPVYIEDDDDILPPCPICDNNQFLSN